MTYFQTASAQVASSRDVSSHAVSPEGQPKTPDPKAKSMAQGVAARTFLIAFLVTATGLFLLLLLAHWFFVIRRRKLWRQTQKNDDEEKNLNGGTTPSTAFDAVPLKGPPQPIYQPSTIALDRDPTLRWRLRSKRSPHHPPRGLQPSCHVTPKLGPTTMDATVAGVAGAVSTPFRPVRPPPQNPGPRLSLWPTTLEAETAERTRAENLARARRTVSAHPRNSTDRVYAGILADPLERRRTWSSPPPPDREDAGWPLLPTASAAAAAVARAPPSPRPSSPEPPWPPSRRDGYYGG
ncbi:hypothetical protein F5144DRAFT_548112 [Chaetomium tenue]|uniref:Uncharacterized protein n=1 Tax=Chaetomium tenue TaxID=1854479 RepID=A0ACB7P710_9PEZI|nr:hypothetical protein F5144DRAFT_548112 [Chaetomium globosum]